MTNVRHMFGILLILSASPCNVGTALAQERREDAQGCTNDAAKAHVLFLEGKRLSKEWIEDQRDQTLEAACLAFAESHCLDPMAGTAASLGDCEYKQSKFASAYGYYEKALVLAGHQKNQSVLKSAKEALDELEDKVSSLKVHIEEPVPGLQIQIDGQVVGKAQFELFLPYDPGEHVIAAIAEGYIPQEQRVTIGVATEHKTVDIPRLELKEPEPTPAPVSPPLSPPAPPTAVIATTPVVVPSARVASQSPTSPWPWVLGGVGATALIVGGVSGILAMHDRQTLQTNCDLKQPYDLCRDQALRAKGRGDFAATLALVSGSVGVVALATTAYWQFIRKNKRENGASAHASIQFDVTTHNNGGQLWLTGGF